MTKPIQTAVAGVSGYAGGELARLLLAHPRLRGTEPLFLSRSGEVTRSLEQLHPQLTLGEGRSLPPVVPFDWKAVEDAGVELAFLALPHETSRAWVPQWIGRGIKVVDLSGAWRLNDPANLEVYCLDDQDSSVAQALQDEAVYGCPELHRERIAKARLIANPGCYATSIILPLAPLLKDGIIDLDHGIVCDAKSGVSGAGKAPSPRTHFMYAADNLSAYSVFGHRHTGELLEQLDLAGDQIQFTPHLLPIPRGILSTIYVRLSRYTELAEIADCLRASYGSSPMVRLHPTPNLPQIQHVVRTSYCDIGFQLAPDGKRLVLISCIDNLLKGASGQAIQNMNLMCGWKEEEGLL